VRALCLFLCTLTISEGSELPEDISSDSLSDNDNVWIIIVSVIAALVVLVILLVVLILLVRYNRLKSAKQGERSVNLELEVRNTHNSSAISKIHFRIAVSSQMFLLNMQSEGETLDRCTKVSGKEQLKLH
jgi:heme/copper-type cytochrome/quinol oxidase subunit 2